MELFLELTSHKPLTPHEAWTSEPVTNPKMLKKVGTNAYVHKEGLELKIVGKVDSRAKKMTLIGYRDSSIYQLYNKKVDQIVLSYNVDFNEFKLTSSLNPFSSSEIPYESFSETDEEDNDSSND